MTIVINWNCGQTIVISTINLKIKYMHESSQHESQLQDKNTLIEYRLTKLEEGITALNTMKDVVVRWDTRFSQNEDFLQCSIHKLKMQQFEIELKNMSGIVTELDRFKWKAVGVLSVVMLFTQIFGTTIVQKFLKSPDPVRYTISYSDSTNHLNQVGR